MRTDCAGCGWRSRVQACLLYTSRRGLTLAKVTNVTDPEKFNRVKCLPIGSENTESKEETDWCYVMAPAGGMERGIFWFPRLDDLVVLAYLDDDPHRPLVIGSLWTTEVKPPYTCLLYTSRCV